MKGRAFHGSWALLHLSAFVVAVLIAWTALAEDGFRARSKLAFAVIVGVLHGLSSGHHARRCYGD